MRRVIRRSIVGGLMLLVLSAVSTAEAGRRHAYQACPDNDCGPEPAASCEPRVVERTIMVPQMTMEKRTVRVTQYRCESHPEVVTCTRLVPEVRTYKRTVTVMTPERRTRVEKCMVRKPVCREVTYEAVVQVPHVEKREGVRMVTHYVATKEQRVLCEDQGHFEERAIDIPICETSCEPDCGRRGLFRRRGGLSCDVGGDCGMDCGGEKQFAEKVASVRHTVQRVWVPNMVERKVEVVVHRPQCVEEKYQYNVVVCRPEKQVRKRMVTDYVEEPSERVVTYFECVPKTREIVCHDTVCKPVTEQRTITRTVRIPYTVEKEISVPVCHMVEKKVLCTLPPNCGPACRNCR